MKQQLEYMIYTLEKLLNPIDQARLETLRKIAKLTETRKTSVLVIGAFARDLLFFNRFGIPTGAGTNDLDFTLNLISWEDFGSFTEELNKQGFKQPALPGHPEKFIDTNKVEIDIIPFGSISGNSKELIWPDGSSWNTQGIKETMEYSWALKLGESRINIASAAAIVMLKIFAITDRPEDRKEKDVRDIFFILRNYLDIGNRQRLGKDGKQYDFLVKTKGDLDLATAMLIGYDIGEIVDKDTFELLKAILVQETTSNSRCFICHELRKHLNGSFGNARDGLKSLLAGLSFKR